MKQLVNSPQQFYSFDEQVETLALDDYFGVSAEQIQEYAFPEGFAADGDVAEKNGNKKQSLNKKQKRAANWKKSSAALSPNASALNKNTAVFDNSRKAFLYLLEINFLNAARPLFPGTLKELDAKAMNMDLDNWKKSVVLLDNLKKTWKDNFGGNPDAINEALKKGFSKAPFTAKKAEKKEKPMIKKDFKKPIKNTMPVKNVAEVKEEYSFYSPEFNSTTAVAAATPIITATGEMIKSSGVNKTNPFVAGKEPDSFKEQPEIALVPENFQGASPIQQAEAIENMIAVDPSLSAEQKNSALGMVKSAVKYMNEVATNPAAKKDIEKAQHGTAAVVVVMSLAALAAIIWYVKK